MDYMLMVLACAAGIVLACLVIVVTKLAMGGKRG